MYTWPEENPITSILTDTLFSLHAYLGHFGSSLFSQILCNAAIWLRKAIICILVQLGNNYTHIRQNCVHNRQNCTHYHLCIYIAC